jgi:hypothetical protein
MDRRASFDRLLHQAHVLKCGPGSWRTKLHGDLPSRGEREINLTAKRNTEGGEAAVSQSADFGPLEAR